MSEFSISRNELGFTVYSGLAHLSRDTFGGARVTGHYYNAIPDLEYGTCCLCVTPMDTIPAYPFGPCQNCIFSQDIEDMDTLRAPPFEQYSLLHAMPIQNQQTQDMLAALAAVPVRPNQQPYQRFGQR